MDRILKGTRATIRCTFSVGGVDTNPSPDSCTVEVLRANGTVLVSSTTATDDGAGTFAYVLTTTHTALLDHLTARWTATIDGAAQTLETHIEVVGGFLFSLTDMRQLTPFNKTDEWTVAKLQAARIVAETALEDACGVAFVPRYAREVIAGNGTTDVLLRYPRVTSVRAGTITGTALTAGELAALVAEPTGVVYHSAGWTVGRGNVVVEYEHGWPYPPPRVSKAALILAKRFALDRSTSMTDSQTGQIETIRAPADLAFQVPEVAEVVATYGYRSMVA